MNHSLPKLHCPTSVLRFAAAILLLANRKISNRFCHAQQGTAMQPRHAGLLHASINQKRQTDQ
ncbi:MAG: hypothetical protein A3K04_01730 [Gallionellales bacterium RBG_16_56_9]|nr:MAG: hypothetical protein A3K04_01730 [Gallionellales bacterium RBG_16_56_9]